MIPEIIINELSLYKKEDYIENPNELIVFSNLPKKISRLINSKAKYIVISRRSVFHIIQKGYIGIFLFKTIKKCFDDFDMIFISDKYKTNNINRYLIFKRKAWESRDVSVVIECVKEKDSISIVTAMIADEKYLFKKFKKLG